MKKKQLIIAILLLCTTFTKTAQSQVLISLLLGDKLNSPKLEFGLDGGGNLLNMTNTPKDSGSSINGAWLADWNLGFYFDIKLKREKWGVHTGVFVKGAMGTKNLTPYNLSTDALDSAFLGGSVDRKINYFYVPILMRYNYYKGFFAQGGVQAGLRYKGYDNFYNSVEDKNDLQYTVDVRDDYSRLDFGGFLGLGYKFSKGVGMTLHVDYYAGIVDVNNALAGNQNNQAVYFNASIPIGKKKAASKVAEKNATEQ